MEGLATFFLLEEMAESLVQKLSLVEKHRINSGVNEG
jgi:hypothetical protein